MLVISSFSRILLFLPLDAKVMALVAVAPAVGLLELSSKSSSLDPEKLEQFTKCDIFTPSNTCSLMASFLKKKGNLLEPSVGEGNLLSNIDLSLYSEIDIFEIKKHYLDKCPNVKNICKYHCDFLKKNIEKKYDNIILNPPYIRIQDLEKEYITFLKKKWNILQSGNIDIYYFFLMKCLELLNDDGIMVSVTPNSFLYNKSAKPLRKFMIENRFLSKIIDYKSEKIFPNVSTYCCICIFHMPFGIIEPNRKRCQSISIRSSFWMKIFLILKNLLL